MFIDNGNRTYTFNGDLEQFLLEKGVEVEHIKKMKKINYNIIKVVIISNLINLKEKEDLCHCQEL